MQIIPVAQKKKKCDFINGEHLFGIIVRTNSSISGATLQIRRNFPAVEVEGELNQTKK